MIDANIDFSKLKSHDDYLKLWKELRPLEITCVEKNEECPHCVGDRFVAKNPYALPETMCKALKHVIELYAWRAALGFPSWNSEDHSVYKLHCPDPKGTVWEMRRLPAASGPSPESAL